MNFFRLGRPLAIVLVATFALSSCAANERRTANDSDLKGTLNAAGASSQGAAQQTWVAGFQTAHPDATVNYDPSGSGAGRESFIGGGASFAGSDSYLNDEELAGTFATCAPGTSAIDLPVYIAPIAVIFRLDGIDDLRMDPATLAGIFASDITRWDDPAIAALNPDTALPDLFITAVHRSDDSGTTKNFADYLFQAAPEVWSAEPSDTFPFSSGEGAAQTSGVVSAVTNGVGTIGYTDASRAGELDIVRLKVGDDFVTYTAEAAAASVAGSPRVPGRADNDLALDLNRITTDPTEYPLVLVSYAIVCTEYADAQQGELVKEYVTYLVSAAGQAEAAASAGSAPMSSDLQETVTAIVATIS
ncbi:MAG: phosphate ABC transporter substrate-binding protein PstS [Cryobacterium sp.]